MWRSATICLVIVMLYGLQGCGTTVSPGQRGLRWYPLTEGLTTETLKSGFWPAAGFKDTELGV